MCQDELGVLLAQSIIKLNVKWLLFDPSLYNLLNGFKCIDHSNAWPLVLNLDPIKNQRQRKIDKGKVGKYRWYKL